MSDSSFIYSNIRIYRLCMNLLYGGRYYSRFNDIIPFIKGKKVTELCFGDTVIATWCSKNGIAWKGYDINSEFVKEANRKGYDANLTDTSEAKSFEPADTCIIAGSLYHFHYQTDSLFKKMLACAPRIILSEPIINLSAGKGIIGKLARASANVNGNAQPFRYSEKILLEELTRLAAKLEFSFQVEGYCSKDIIIVIQKNEHP